MTFLEEPDYQPLITDAILNQVIQNQPALLDEAEGMAMAEMESYLGATYDTNAIFSQTGQDRNKAVVMYMIDLVMYHLHARVPGRNTSQLRVDRYNAAMQWLERCMQGELTPNLPPRQSPEGEDENRFRWGSQHDAYLDWW